MILSHSDRRPAPGYHGGLVFFAATPHEAEISAIAYLQREGYERGGDAGIS